MSIVEEITPAEAWPIESLAEAEVYSGGATADDVPGVEYNLRMAESFGQLHRFVENGQCLGFVSWIRTDLDGLMAIASQKVKVLGPSLQKPEGDVIFATECLGANYNLAFEMRRLLVSQPGCRFLACWTMNRTGQHRLRVRRTRLDDGKLWQGSEQ